MKKWILTLLLASSALLAGKINIAVAANVSYAMDALKEEFEKSNPQTQVQVTLGSSGKLNAQILNGAPYGLFMSADMNFPHALHAKKIAITKEVVYAQGELAYLSVKPIDFSKGMEVLKESSVSRIAVANPATAPYGKAAVEAMKNGGVYESVKEKFVFAESVSQTVAYTVTAADIGFIAKSSLYSSKMAQFKEGINWKTVDAKLYTPIQQGMVLLKYGEGQSEYKVFYDFILSEKGKAVLRKYGYLV
ncbi:molybdate ABC transporter substrate-binding protein [bacterium]|nr:molybdate ABC transporter substrate-binding protein [bacterium]MBU1994903.1 molybdate ABC transporter substrate-binding protein [bacterium]